MRTGRPRKLTDLERKERKKAYSLKYYEKNKELIASKVKKWQNENKEKFKTAVRDRELRINKEFEIWKSTLKCSKCPENHVSCLEFHHLDPTKKDKSITNLRNSKKKLEIELQKCIVLCSNCHKKLHYQEKKGKI